MKIKNSGSYTATVKRNHSLTLMPAIDYLMSQLNLAPTAIDCRSRRTWIIHWLTFRRDDCQNIGLYFKERASRHFQSTNVSCQLCWANRFSCASFDARRKTSMLVLIGLSMACGKMSYRTNIFPCGSY